jgi:hypothetical protein
VCLAQVADFASTRFRLVKWFPCRARPPHPINIKGTVDWGSNRPNQSTFIFLFLPFALNFSITCYSSFISTLIEGVLRGLADSIATLRALPQRDPAWATCGGLPPVHPGKGLTFTSLTGGQRSDQWLTPVWPIPTHGCCSESLYVLVDRTLVPTLVEQQWFLLGADSLMSLVPVHVITTMIAFSIHYLSFILWSLSMQPPLNWWW